MLSRCGLCRIKQIDGVAVGNYFGINSGRLACVLKINYKAFLAALRACNVIDGAYEVIGSDSE